MNFINKCLTDDRLWAGISLIAIALYLSPLFNHLFYVPVFDNLDSTVVWYKILAKSGMIFADNNAVIPNMMNGLPRSSYGSEFDVVLWLYYFFEPKTAFVINEIIMHLVAFFSMFVFLKKYVVKENKYYKNVPVFVGALYFALIPYWSGAGLSIASLPIVTYALLNIKNHTSTKWDWILLVFLPLYTSLIFLYMFYIIMAGMYLLYDTLKNRKLNRPFFLALVLMGIMFLLSEYRLVYAMFFDPGFISHREAFDIFFRENLFESYRLALVNFLEGHVPHAQSLQQTYVLPVILIALVLSLVKKRFNRRESIIAWTLILLSFSVDLWHIVLVNRYTLPGIVIFSLYLVFFRKEERHIPLLLLLVVFLSFFAAMFEYNGMKWLGEILPIFKKLNFVRMIFVEPFIFAILLALSSVLVIRKLRFALIFVVIFMVFQFHLSYTQSFYQAAPKKGYASFEDYYAPALFEKLKKAISSYGIQKVRFVSYGIEPAVALYNDLYTADGYSTNYPLRYKHAFRRVFSSYCRKGVCDLYDRWGSKAYILTIANLFSSYHKGLKVKALLFDTNALCQLDVSYMITPYKLLDAEKKGLKAVDTFYGSATSWDIYLYKLKCNKATKEP